MGGRGSGPPPRISPIGLAQDRAAYDRQPDEGSKAWQAFVCYRDLGPDRSHVKVKASLGKRNLYMIQRWSMLWSWRLRLAEWDREIDRRKTKTDFLEIEKMRRRHIQLATTLQGLGAVELNKLLAAAQAASSSSVTPADLLKILETGVKMERAGRGDLEEATNKVTVNVTVAEIVEHARLELQAAVCPVLMDTTDRQRLEAARERQAQRHLLLEARQSGE